MRAPNKTDGLAAFVAVYETESFTQAGALLGVPRSTVSRAIAALEERLGRTLFHRTTRRVSATREADLLYDRVAPALRTLEAAVEDGPAEGEPQGRLHLASTVDLGVEFLAGVVQRYSARYPKVQVDLSLSHETVDLVAERIDLALRVWTQRPRSGDLKARKLGDIYLGAYASPSYLRRVRDPEERTWIAYSWDHGQHPEPHIVCDDMLVCRALLCAGAGVGLIPTFVAHEQVQRGNLVAVPEISPLRAGALYLVRPDQEHLPRHVRLFQELTRQLFDARQFVPEP